jgi:hypothetical protein
MKEREGHERERKRRERREKREEEGRGRHVKGGERREGKGEEIFRSYVSPRGPCVRILFLSLYSSEMMEILEDGAQWKVFRSSGNSSKGLVGLVDP